ncbi:Hypothetical predicted protein [Octopus vulgaris]|uniref:Uncharacterized protein n=1 Tax=Octopus vulgaris TaxID=6645 RepID=A0AA36B0A5_OCTVU|nr:Hypothetical predicted protein [Octopus vulgaris]
MFLEDSAEFANPLAYTAFKGVPRSIGRIVGRERHEEIGKLVVLLLPDSAGVVALDVDALYVDYGFDYSSIKQNLLDVFGRY